MYVPDHFRLPEDRIAQILASPRAGNLVTTHEDGPLATLVPFHLEQRETGTVLVTHLVRNNPQATTPAIDPALVVPAHRRSSSIGDSRVPAHRQGGSLGDSRVPAHRRSSSLGGNGSPSEPARGGGG